MLFDPATNRSVAPRHVLPGLVESRRRRRAIKLGRGGPEHASSVKSHRVIRGVGLILTGALTFTAASAGAVGWQVSRNITTIDTEQAMSIVQRPTPPPPPDPSDPRSGVPMNILVLGIDDRSGENLELGGHDEGILADTAMVAHISADRSRIDVISIPRDSVVDIPACPTSSGALTRPRAGIRFNAAFAIGYNAGGDIESGALCTMTTVEQLTNIRLDGFVLLDFIGFLRMVDALGGVEMCFEQEIFSRKANYLHILPGCQVLDGHTALQFARARTGQGLGDGSDLSRIRRQHELLAAMARDVHSSNLLADTPSLIQFLNATTRSLTMSSSLGSLPALTGLAFSLRNIDLSEVNFSTVPYKVNPANPNTVVWTSEAAAVWASMKGDTELNLDPDTRTVESSQASVSPGANQ